MAGSSAGLTSRDVFRTIFLSIPVNCYTVHIKDWWKKN